jgi:hypothetical protein
MRNIAALHPTIAESCPSRVSARAFGLLARNERVLFAAMILALLLPVWSVPYLPTTDGAAHVANADVMRKIEDPSLPVFRQYYLVSHDPSPNLIGHLVLAALLYVAPPLVAEKILVSLYMILFPLAVRYGVRSVRKNATPLAFLAFPMAYSYLFAQGFYNFCLSMAAFFLVVGYWLRNRDRLDSRRAVVLLVLGMLLYACHLFSLVLACGVIGLMVTWFGMADVRARWLRKAVKRAIISALVLAPGLVMAVLFRPSAEKFQSTDPDEWHPKDDLVGLLQFSSMTSYRNAETWLGGALATVFAALALWALANKLLRRTWTKWDGLLLVPAGLLAVYFKAHDAASAHFYIPQRVMFYCFLTLLLWLAGQPMTRRIRRAVIPLGMLLGVAFVASHAHKYRQFAPQLAEFVSAGDHIQRNSTFLPLIFAPRGLDASGRPISIDVSPFYMASGYIAARRDAVDLRNYEANTDHFPVRFRPERNPYDHLAVGKGLDSIPPVIDFNRFDRAGGRVDYVLLWGVTDDLRRDPATVRLYEQLARAYERIDLPNSARTELWKRRGF